MATKVFLTNGSGYSLISDERDIMVSRTYYLEVIQWCAENGISIYDNGQRGAAAFGVNLWRIENEAQRLVFMLRWGFDGIQ